MVYRYYTQRFWYDTFLSELISWTSIERIFWVFLFSVIYFGIQNKMATNTCWTQNSTIDKLNTDLCTVKTFYIFKLFLNFHKVLKTTNQPFNTKKNIKLCENLNVFWVILFSKKLREKIASQKARTFLIELLQNSHLDVTTHNFLLLNLH